jgi:predicted nucleotidyltransferase
MNQNIETLINEIKNIIGNRFLSAVLYGSYVDKSNTKSSDINIIVVIEQLTAVDLKNLNPVMKKWQKSNKSIPIFIGKTEWFASSDVYPMEYADIKDRYSILYGDDIVSELKIDKCHIRLQCESEIKNLLIRLRQSYVQNSFDKKIISELILNSSKSLIAILKAVLRLVSDEKITNDKYQIINEVSPLIGLDAEFFTKILKFRDNKKIFSSNDYELIIQKLIDSIYDVLKYVDKINTCKEV